jgi:CubicO group peptidase (beta-lactamase class C family)
MRRRLRTLVQHVADRHPSPMIPEQVEALADQQEQRRLSGGGVVKGYRPDEVTPWVWDTDQTVQGVRWSYSHTRELTLTANVSRGPGATSALPHADELLDVGGISFATLSQVDHEAEAVGSAEVWHSFESMLRETHTDCCVVLHRGKIVYERYFHGATTHTKRLGMSMTKTYTSMLVGILAGRGLLQMSDLLTSHLPELDGSGYTGATVQNALDMCVAVDYDEDEVYSGTPFTGTQMYNHTIAWGGYPPTQQFVDEGWPRTNYSFLVTQRPAPAPRKHGDYEYQSCVTEALGMLVERVSGQRFSTFLSEALWSRLGCEDDGDMQLDRVGAAVACGGLCATARDWARFGLCLSRDGINHLGEQIIPREYVLDSRTSKSQVVPYDVKRHRRDEFVSCYHNKLWIVGEAQDVCCKPRNSYVSSQHQILNAKLCGQA